MKKLFKLISITFCVSVLFNNNIIFANTYDISPLRLNASFDVPVADGVWWVPTNQLGGTRYSNEQIATIVNLTPEEKQNSISTLYEAIQLYKISGYSNAQTNQKIKDYNTNTMWELHIDGYNTVRINCGNCAGSTAWLNYILDDDYEEQGCFAFIGTKGGHIINYFKHNGFYYFIDMTNFKNDSKYSCTENGNLTNYKNSNILGSIHKAISPEAYVAYIDNNFKNIDYCLYYMYSDDIPINLGRTRGTNNVIFPSNKKDSIKIIYFDNTSDFTYGYEPYSTNVIYYWDTLTWPTYTYTNNY